MDIPDTLDVQQAAAMLHADPDTVLSIARSGELPGTKIGRSWVFLRCDLLCFLQKRIDTDTAQRRQRIAESLQPLALVVEMPRPRRRTKLPPLPELPT